MAADRSASRGGPSFGEAVAEHGDPRLMGLGEAGGLTPDAIEELGDPELLSRLVEPVAAHARQVLIHWQPLLEPMRSGATKGPLKEMQALERLLQATGVALSAHVGVAGCDVGLERVRTALTSVRRWLPDASEKAHLVASRYDGPVAARPTTTAEKRKAKPLEASTASILLTVLAIAAGVAGIAHAARFVMARPDFDELAVEHYQELVPAVLEKELVGGHRMVFTMSNEWAGLPVGQRVDDGMILLEASAVEGWRSFVVVDEGKRSVLRSGSRGELVIVRGDDVP